MASCNAAERINKPLCHGFIAVQHRPHVHDELLRIHGELHKRS